MVPIAATQRGENLPEGTTATISQAAIREIYFYNYNSALAVIGRIKLA
jgi:hypothetical protein